MTCSDIELKDLEALLSTAVGVSFIFPVIVQLLNDRSRRLIELAQTLVKELSDQNDGPAIRDLGSLVIQSRKVANSMDRVAGYLVGLSSICALVAFTCLVWSVYQSQVCLSPDVSAMIVFIVSLPVISSGGFFVWWWDASRPLISRCAHYYDS